MESTLGNSSHTRLLDKARDAQNDGPSSVVPSFPPPLTATGFEVSPRFSSWSSAERPAVSCPPHRAALAPPDRAARQTLNGLSTLSVTMASVPRADGGGNDGAVD